MPQGDGTSAKAMGLMTGRGAGNCTGSGIAGRSRCGWFNASELAGRTPKENEKKLLRDEAAALSKQLDDVGRRLKEL